MLVNFRVKTKRRGKRLKVEHKGSSKQGTATLDQAGQVQCDNGPKNIPVWQSYQIDFRFKNEKTLHCIRE